MFCWLICVIFLCLIFGHPLFLFPSGAQVSNTLAIAARSILRVCPNHLHCLLLIMFSRVSCLLTCRSLSLKILLGQKILINLSWVVWIMASARSFLLHRASLVLQHFSYSYCIFPKPCPSTFTII